MLRQKGSCARLFNSGPRKCSHFGVNMPRGKCAFKQCDVTRAIKAARKAGVEPTRVEIDNGKIIVIAEKPEAASEINALDVWIAKHARQT
jgi:hypothetical protein